MRCICDKNFGVGDSEKKWKSHRESAKKIEKQKKAEQINYYYLSSRSIPVLYLNRTMDSFAESLIF